MHTLINPKRTLKPPCTGVPQKLPALPSTSHVIILLLSAKSSKNIAAHSSQLTAWTALIVQCQDETHPCITPVASGVALRNAFAVVHRKTLKVHPNLMFEHRLVTQRLSASHRKCGRLASCPASPAHHILSIPVFIHHPEYKKQG